MNKITWKQRNIEGWKLAEFLTKHNFQPGKFIVIPAIDGSAGWVTIIAVEKEQSNA